MMHFQAVHLGFCFGDRTETIRLHIAAHGKRRMLRKKVSHFFGR